MRVAACLALLALVPLTGCVQGEQAFTLFPDGSGKVVVHVGIKKQVLKMLGEMAKSFGGKTPDGMPIEDPFAEFRDPKRLARDSEGIVAWVPGVLKDDGEWIRTRLEGYFEDINKVRLYSVKTGPNGASTRKLSFSARMTSTPDGGTITLGHSVAGEIDELKARMAGDESPEATKAALELIKPLLQDLNVKVSLTLPGPVTASKGFLQSEGRTVSLGFDGALMISVATNPQGEAAQRLEAIVRAGESSASWSGSEATAEALALFREEMNGAKASWTKLRGDAAPAPPKPPSLAADADQLSDDEVDRLFIDAQIKIARDQIRSGQKAKARATLEGVLKDFPKAKAAQEAKTILDGLKN
ncbi:MAG TPA: hypothetical protein VF950_12140 [Planctomycetota bacterium]